MKEVIIDVRERDEFEAEHIKNSINVPLSHFSSVAPGVLDHFMDAKVTIMCRSGARAKMAENQALALGFSPAGGYQIYDGGILKWKKQGLDTVAHKAGHLPILRQTHIAAGLISLVGVLLGFFVNTWFFLIPGFVGAGLTFAGVSGICMMSNILGAMPWNKSTPELKKEICLASKGTASCEVGE
jgi:rhodanese-related sulfurtransferase